MTWDTLAAGGSGVLVLWLRIAGLPWLFGWGHDRTPHASDTWYWDGAAARFSGVKPWLRLSMTHDERGSFVDGSTDIGGVAVELHDPAGQLTAMMSAWSTRKMTRLTATLAQGAVASMTVDSTAKWTGLGSGVVYVGQEAIKWTGQTGTTFTGLTRGYYGTLDVDHDVDADALPAPILPSVTDGIASLDGRRADIYAATLDGGVLSQSTCIYRGYVASTGDPGATVWPIKVDHIVKMLGREACLRLPRTTLRRGYSFSGVTRASSFQVIEVDHSVSPPTMLTADVEIDEGRYADDYELSAEIQVDLAAAQSTAGFTRCINMLWWPGSEDIPDVGWCFSVDLGASYSLSVRVQEGDPLWVMGFDPGWYHWDPSGASTAPYLAQRDPLAAYLEIPSAEYPDVDLTVEVDDPGCLIAGLYVRVAGSPAVKILSISGNEVTLDTSTWDPEYLYGSTSDRQLRYWAVEEAKDLVVQHVFALVDSGGGPIALYTALSRLLGLSGSEPTSWGVAGFGASDIDCSAGGELGLALEGASYELSRIRAYLSGPTSVSGLIFERLGLLGICPRLTGAGVIGFTRLKIPCALDAESIEVDSAVCEAFDAARVRTAIGAGPRITELRIQHSYDYVADSWPDDPAVLAFDDGIEVLGKCNPRTYVAHGLYVAGAAPPSYPTEMHLLHDVLTRAIGAHFGRHGRLAPVVKVPCTWKARQFKVGDIIRLTHPCVVDVAEGVIGCTDRLGQIVGRRHSITRPGETDYLEICIPPELNVGGISPAALATSWDPGTLKLTFADTSLFCQTGDTDLDYFGTADEVRFREWDKAAPTTWGPATIDEVDTVNGTATLTADPFGGGFVSCTMTYAAYDEQREAQLARGFITVGDGSYSLGAGGDDAFVWSL